MDQTKTTYSKQQKKEGGGIVFVARKQGRIYGGGRTGPNPPQKQKIKINKIKTICELFLSAG